MLLVAAFLAAISFPAGSRQALVVTTPSASATTGTLQRYEKGVVARRASTRVILSREDGEGSRASGEWRAVGAPIPVVVGRSGIARPSEKHEGDGKSPSGTFPIGTTFGFAPSSDFHMPYRQLLDTTECVDDTASRFYNMLVDRDRVKVDWTSSEKMRKVSEYVWGAVVDYNTPPAKGKGSCIFLHVWGGPGSTTSGCTAMSEENLLIVLRWLDPKKKPVLIQSAR